MKERTPDIYERTQILLDNWKKERHQLDQQIRTRVEEGVPAEWLMGLLDMMEIRYIELESILRGNCPPETGETKMLPEGKVGRSNGS